MPLLSVYLHDRMYDSAVQKGMIPGLAGGSELGSVLTALMDPSDSTPQEHPKRVQLSREEVEAARKARKENNKKRKRGEDETGQRPLPEESQCSFWMLKKKRYCNLSRYTGTKPRGPHPSPES